MLKRITHTFIHVLDQDQALDFYVGKLGMVIHTDADLGPMRFLTVTLPEQPELELVLMAPGPPAYDDATVDASLDRGEERVTADADSRTRLKDLRYAYFIGYNARAREDSKPYATLGDEVGHPSKQVSTQVMPVPQKQVPAHFTPPKRVAQAR